jgi:hypothetical protein
MGNSDRTRMPRIQGIHTERIHIEKIIATSSPTSFISVNPKIRAIRVLSQTWCIICIGICNFKATTRLNQPFMSIVLWL